MKRMLAAALAAFGCGCAAFDAIADGFSSPRVGRVSLSGGGGGWRLSGDCRAEADGVETWHVALVSDREARPPSFTLSFEVPQEGMRHVWTTSRTQCLMPPDWSGDGRIRADVAAHMPLAAVFGGDETNRLTLACSEARRVVNLHAGLREEGCRVRVVLDFLTAPDVPCSRYEVDIRLDPRRVFWADAVRGAAEWMSSVQDRPPAVPPPAAYTPLYSTWYAFHQNVFAADIEAECALAAKLGMRTLIVDDGWQTDDTNRGYAFCGDWRESKRRFPDMRAHVAKVHALGIKYMMWYAVPFIGKKSANYERFKGKYLSTSGDAATLDPRFPEVRDFLASTYERAMREWDLDGFKLDFIDSFPHAIRNGDPAAAENWKGRDIRSLSEAVDVLMSDIARRLKAIKPDVLIEFRQPYVGPVIRKSGNMLRVADCGGDGLRNRIGIAQLRVTSGRTAVHSDMLEWNPKETPEEVGRLVLECLFGTIQYSMMLRELPEGHRAVLENLIGFTMAHEATLQHAEFRPHHPEAGYPLVEAESAAERIVAAYLPETVVDVGTVVKPTWLFNATGSGRLEIRLSAVPRTVRCFDVFGRSVPAPSLTAGLNDLRVPVSGRLELAP